MTIERVGLRFAYGMGASLLLLNCAASVTGGRDDGGREDGAVTTRDTGVGRDATLQQDVGPIGRDATGVDAIVGPESGGPDVVIPPRDAGVPGDPTGPWRMTLFRFSLLGNPTQISDTNRSIPADPMGRYRVNGTLDIRADRLALSWGILRNDHFFVSDPSVDLDQGYSGTAAYFSGRLDRDAQRFFVGAFSLDYVFDSPNVLSLRSEREGWSALFVRDMPTAAPLMPNVVFEGQALQIDPATSDPFVRPRVTLLWDVPGSAEFIESSAVDFNLGAGGGAALFRMSLPNVPAGAMGMIGGTTVAFAHICVYDDVDRNGRFGSSMVGGVGPDIPRGISPIGIAVRGSAAGTGTFSESPFRLLQSGWQFVNVERDSEPRPAVLVPYSNTNPVRPDVVINDTPVRRRILDLLP
ncbi:MAG: hypothetical protein Q8Q09_23255 [Deltaproteobacteria bacterium]|nr:hypothetical protein [Deltaproteobacteria bacterium]